MPETYGLPVVSPDYQTFADVPHSGGAENSRWFGGPRGGGGQQEHAGIDIYSPAGSPVIATQDGVVVRSDNSNPSGYGNTIDIRYPDGTVHRYAHLANRAVSVGDHVTAGQTVGAVGSTGNAAGGGAHLHYEVIDGAYYDSHGGRPPGRGTAGRIDPSEYWYYNPTQGDGVFAYAQQTGQLTGAQEAAEGQATGQPYIPFLRPGQGSSETPDANVRQLQRFLNRNARSHLDVDGIFGPRTQQAVMSFQGQNGIHVDGIVGPETYGAIAGVTARREQRWERLRSVLPFHGRVLDFFANAMGFDLPGAGERPEPGQGIIRRMFENTRPGAPQEAAAPQEVLQTATSETTPSYSVQGGDTLWDIAEEQLGDPSRWREIAALNDIADPRRLQVGTPLRLPATGQTPQQGAAPVPVPPQVPMPQQAGTPQPVPAQVPQGIAPTIPQPIATQVPPYGAAPVTPVTRQPLKPIPTDTSLGMRPAPQPAPSTPPTLHPPTGGEYRGTRQHLTNSPVLPSFQPSVGGQLPAPGWMPIPPDTRANHRIPDRPGVAQGAPVTPVQRQPLAPIATDNRLGERRVPIPAPSGAPTPAVEGGQPTPPNTQFPQELGPILELLMGTQPLSQQLPPGFARLLGGGVVPQRR